MLEHSQGQSMPSEKTPYWKKIIYILTAGWIVIWIYRVILTPIYPIISEYFGGASDAALGSISSFYFLGYVVMQIPSGLLVDKFGRRNIIVPGFILFGLGVLLVATASTLTMVYMGSVLAGLGCGTYYGVAYSLTGDYVPADKKSFSTAIVNSGTAVGSGLGLVASSHFVGTGILPWQTLVLITVALILVMMVIFAKFIRPEEKTPVTTPAKVADLAPVSESKLKQLIQPQMIAAYILYFSTLYTYYLIDTWLPNFLETERGFEGTAVGFAASLVFFTGVPGALIFSKFADKLPDKKVSIIIFLELLAAAMLYLTITTGNQTVLVFGIIAYGFFGKLAVEPIIISWLGQFVSKKNIATAYGVFNFFGMSSSVIVPSLTGYISDITGSKVYAFYLALAIILVGTSIFFIINRTANTSSVRQR